MTTFVLIHGAWCGGWCWNKTVSELEARGHKAIAPDLPGMGSDTTPFSAAPLSDWADFVADIIRGEDEQVVLVGHSRGGVVISEVAERVPDRISRLVYWAAFLLKNGQTMGEIAAEHVEGDTSPPLPVDFAEDRLTCTVDPNLTGPIFYNQCSEEEIASVSTLLTAEPTASIITPVSVTDTKFGSVPRAYIEAANDQAIDIRKQRKMHYALPCNRVLTLESDHCSFYFRPSKLVDMLVTFA